MLRALRHRLPQEDFIYLGDTARLPYGTKSAGTITQYALQAAQMLRDHDIKLLVVACNTASALALPGLTRFLPDLPVVGVIEAGADAAAATSPTGKIAVLATEGTIRSGAYASAIAARRSAAAVCGIPCTLLVALAEEGWHEGPIAEAVIRRYLDEVKLQDIDTILLGCTHFPLLTSAIRAVVGDGVAVVDSAETTADAVAALIQSRALSAMGRARGTTRFLATDSPERFARIATRFLGEPVAEAQVALCCLGPSASQREENVLIA